MNPLVYLASYDDLAQIAINSKPTNYAIPDVSDPNILLMRWLQHWGNLHYTHHGQYEIAQGLRKKPDFDPWCYIAGYPETKQMFWQNGTLNEDMACFAWIIYGRVNNLHKNPKQLCNINARKSLYCINRIQVFGERNTGTNFLQEIIVSNTNVPLVWDFGWKHFPDYDALKNNECSDVLFIMIVRDLESWLHSFKRTMHHVPIDVKNKAFHTFLETAWINSHQSSYENVKCTLIEKRYNHFLKVKEAMCNKNFILLKYEDLKNDQNIILQQLSLYGIESNSIKVTKKIQPGHVISNESFRESKYSQFDKNVLQVINKYKRCDVEKQMGY